MEDPPNSSTFLLPKPSKPPPSLLLTTLVTVTLFSLTSAFAYAFLLFASPLNLHHPSTPLAHPFKKLARPPVILISCDGFCFGYQYKTPTPNIHHLVSKGTEAELGLIPVFPSVTIPNHYSIATGLYPAYSGVVNTHFVDPVTNQTFLANNHDLRLWLGEPIWESAVKHGYPAAVLYWAGGEVKKGS